MNNPRTKKILIFGFWNQAKKYIHFFSARGYFVTVVSASGYMDKKLWNITDIFAYEHIQWIDRVFFLQFSLIIIAVSPILEQEKIISVIINQALSIPCIIEKPVSFEANILEILIEIPYITFFIDETCLAPIFSRASPQNIHIQIGKDRDILEHSIWCFLLHPKFTALLPNICFSLFEFDNNDTGIFYEILTENMGILICKNGTFSLNKHIIADHIFEKNLSFLLTRVFPYTDINTCLKKNFLFLSNFLSQSFEFSKEL